MAENPENLVFMLHQTHDMIRRCEDRVFGEQGLTAEQYSVLTAIECLSEPVRITDVARRLTRSVNSISMIVDRMVNAGLLTRVRDVKDRRTVFVSITRKAAALLKSARPVGQEFIQKILSPLSHEDKQALTRLLETLQCKVSEYLNSHGPVNVGS